jgi:hypothetical protein
MKTGGIHSVIPGVDPESSGISIKSNKSSLSPFDKLRTGREPGDIERNKIFV